MAMWQHYATLSLLGLRICGSVFPHPLYAFSS